MTPNQSLSVVCLKAWGVLELKLPLSPVSHLPDFHIQFQLSIYIHLFFLSRKVCQICFVFLFKALQHIMMNALVKLIWLVSLQCLMVEHVSLESTASVPGSTSEFPLNLIGFCKGAQRNIVLKMSCVIGEYVVKYIQSVFNSVTYIVTS